MRPESRLTKHRRVRTLAAHESEAGLVRTISSMALRTREFQRILLIKPSAVGDVVHTLPVLVKLRARYPKARIDWLVTPAIADLVRHHPAVSNIIHFDRRGYTKMWRSWRAASGFAKLFSSLTRPRYDLVLDLHGQFRSAALAIATGAPVRIGWDRPRKETRGTRRLPDEAYRHGWTGAREFAWLAYTHHIRFPTLEMHAIDRYMRLSPMLGLDEGPPDCRVPIADHAEKRVELLLTSRGLLDQRFAVLVPGTLWETKHWHAEGYAKTARYLMGTGRSVVLAGSPSERIRCRDVAQRAPGVHDLSGQTSLAELAALIRRAAICVTNDSGSMHLAVSLGRPVVCVFGPTDPIWIGPYGRTDAVVRAELPCSPCYLRKLSRCPHDHACMKQVTAENVIQRIEQVLAKQPAVPTDQFGSLRISA